MDEDDDLIKIPTVEVSKAKNSFIPANMDSSSTKLSIVLQKMECEVQERQAISQESI